MPLDPVSFETAIQFVKGSHNWGKWFYPRKFATSKNYQINADFDRYLLNAVIMHEGCHFKSFVGNRGGKMTCTLTKVECSIPPDIKDTTAKATVYSIKKNSTSF